MLSLIGLPVLVLAGLAALATTTAVVVSWSVHRDVGPTYLPSHSRYRSSRLLALVWVRLGAVIVSQVLVLATVGLAVNRQFGFYSTWSDLVGVEGAPAQIDANMDAGGGRLEKLPIPGLASGVTGAEALVWLPPGYDASRRYKVLMFLPGQPSSPSSVYWQFDFGRTSARLIENGTLTPFIAVFAPLSIAPPRDTECTDIPGSTQAEAFLSLDVPRAVISTYPVDRATRGWTVAGWSTGGFCATKLALRHPLQFSAAASFGGYYTPIEDKSTGSLFGGRSVLREANSPLALYRKNGTRGTHLLVITGQADIESWRSTEPMMKAAHGDPRVNFVVFTEGGHNYRNYTRYLPSALRWLQRPGQVSTTFAAGQ